MSKKRLFFSCLVIILIALAAYSNSFLNNFIWDDEIIVVNNELIRDIGNWQKILTQELIPDTKTNYYRPIQTFSYCLDYSIYKLNPFGYHLTNFILHILNAILIYLLIANIMLQATGHTLTGTGRPEAKSLQLGAWSCLELNFIPLFTALFWVVHPAHTEAVSYISGRADLLAAFFMLLTMLLYIRGSLRPYLATRYSLLAAFSFTLALFSREASIIFPVALIAYEYFFRKEIKGKFKRLLPFLLIAGFYILLRLTILNFAGGYAWTKASFYAQSNIVRIFSFSKCLVIYLGLLIFPGKLYMERFMSPATKIFDPYVLTAILLLIMLIVFSRRLPKEKKRFVIFGIFWFFIFLFPQSTFFFTILLADHFLYLPSMGICFILAYGLAAFYGKRKALAWAIFIAIIFFWGLFTFSQNYVWRDSLTFYRWTDRFSPTSFKTRNNLANIYFSLGREDLAIMKYEEALAVSPKTSAIKENISYAEDYFIEKYKNQLKLGLNFALHYYNLACLYERKGRLDEAITYYNKAIEINPKFAEAISNLGNVYEKKGDFEAALTQYRQAISVSPNFAQGYFNIGAVLGNQGKLNEAEAYFEKALKIDPAYREAEDNIAKIKAMLKKTP